MPGPQSSGSGLLGCQDKSSDANQGSDEMTESNIPEGATRIQMTFWTTAPYSMKEREQLTNDFISFVADGGDDDVVSGSIGVEFADKKQIHAQEESALREMLNDAETEVTLKFGPERSDLSITVGGDE